MRVLSLSAALGGRLTDESAPWCYLGADPDNLHHVVNRLGRTRQRSLSRELNRTANELKQPFLNWLDSIGSLQTTPIHWIASKTASKSPLQSDLFLLICYREICHQLINEHESLTVVVEDPLLYQILRQDFSADKKAMFSTAESLWRINCSLLIRSIACRIYVFVEQIWTIALTRWCLLTSGLRSQDSRLSNGVALWTELHDSCFAKPGEFTDLNTGRLRQILKARLVPFFYLIPITGSRPYIRRLMSFPEEAIFMACYARWTDLVASVLAAFRIEAPPTEFVFRSLDYRQLLKRESRREMASLQFFQNLIAYYVSQRFASAEGTNLHSVIYPYEDQPWEKLLCGAFSAKAPKVRMLGYQSSSVPDKLLSFFLGEKEWERIPHPDVLVTNGPYAMELFRQSGYPAAQLVNGGALRYEHFNEETPAKPLRTASRGPLNVLVALPIAPRYAKTILLDLIDIAQSLLGDMDVQFTIKPHPWLPVRRMGVTETMMPNAIQISNETISSLLRTANAFIYTGWTTAMIEAILKGVPVWRYEGEFLNIDSPNPLLDPMIRTCTRESLISEIRSARSMDSARSSADQMALLRKIFGPVNEDVWTQLCSLAPEQQRAAAREQVYA